jgi:four helix bundle protein
MPGHRNLEVWKKSMALVVEMYRVTRTFPHDELYGLVSQLRRAAVSVPSNIAEGYGRNSPRELYQFVGTARGSLAEVETQIEIARDLEYITAELATTLLKKTSEIGRMLTGSAIGRRKRVRRGGLLAASP